ncbi:MAG TPA: tetratricopeptide repeat protein [Methylomirabilota bacterium]|jgi:adenylate cyclase|nr:tetratricopeptide repeat protein [Methylomirabilota bacterium]
MDPKESTARPTAVGTERKLAAILSADVAGYSRLMGEDEVGALRTLTAYRVIIDALIAQHHGRIVGTAGDGVLAEFASVVDAVQCAVAIQSRVKTENAPLPPERQMVFRIGINLGDVLLEGDTIYGDGVNIAARLEGLADPGGICLAGSVYDQIENKLSLQYEDLGEQTVKNIKKPVRTYRVRWEGEENQKAKIEDQESSRFKIQGSTKRRVRLASWATVAGLAFSVAILVAVRYLPLFFPNTQHPTPNTQFSLSTQPSALRTGEAKLSLPDKPSIVILPFDNMSKEPEQDYFSNGITEVLTSDLSRISSLFVIARNTAFTYKGKAINVQEVGRELGVRYVLEGSVQKAGEQVRIVVQLIDATTGEHLWSERFDRPFKDIFALQDEIVQKIVTTLKLQLTLQEQGFLVRKHTDNLEAYDYHLRGLEYFLRTTQEGNAQARQMLERAIALDPQYADAYVLLGITYLLEWLWRWSADLQNLERALALAQQALALDDSLPGAHSLLSQVYAQRRQYDQAIAEGERAIALDPNNALSSNRQGAVLTFAGRPAEAVPLMERAMRLNPHYPPFYIGDLGWTYSLIGRYTEAVAALKEALSRGPTLTAYYAILATCYLQQWASQQDTDSQTLEYALAAAQRPLALNDSSPPSHLSLGSVYLWQKQYEQALAEMELATTLNPNGAGGYALLAETLSRAGKSEEALGMVERALHLQNSGVADQHLSSVGVAYSLAGRPEEAIAPVKQYLIHYPNILGAHLTLSAVYSELGKDAEAHAEAAEVLRLNPKFSLEVHKERVPIKDPAMLERHVAALRKAGLK